MRNILITVLMLIVISVMFLEIVTSNNGTKARIEEKGTLANEKIAEINVE